jgi:hypothetical protein
VLSEEYSRTWHWSWRYDCNGPLDVESRSCRGCFHNSDDDNELNDDDDHELSDDDDELNNDYDDY